MTTRAKYDLQVHTDASPCSTTSPERVVDAALAAGLDGLAVTDHDTLANVDRVRAAAPPDLTIVPGAEVTTSQGHLLAYGVGRAPPQTDPLTVIDDVHDQSGVAVLSHPFDTLREHYTTDLEAIASAVDGVEVVNSRCVREAFNHRAAAFAAKHGLARTGGSDAHFPHELGRGYTEAEEELLTAIREGATTPGGRGRHVSGHVATKIHQFRTWVRS